MSTVVVVDYGMGNLRSVAQAVIHAAASVATCLIAQIELIVVFLIGQIGNARNQILVQFIGSALASIGFEVVDRDAQRKAGAATITIRPISE